MHVVRRRDARGVTRIPRSLRWKAFPGTERLGVGPVVRKVGQRWLESSLTTSPSAMRRGEAVNELNMEVMDKEFLVLVGPSGCGKSTAMRMVAGLEEITEGRIIIGDRVVNDLPPKDRDVAMVFQSYALYPHMTVYDNLAYPLKLRKVPKEERDRRVREAARMLDIEPVARPQAEGALRRSAAARRARPRHRPQRRCLPDGRAALQPRRQAPRADARRADQAARARAARPRST